MRFLTLCFAPMLMLMAASALAGETAQVDLSIKDNGFVPATLHIPADKRVEIRIHNTRAQPAEFESHDMGSEKVIPGNTTLSLWLGPLKSGEYGFFDDFNPGVKGKLVVGACEEDAHCTSATKH